MLCVLVGVLSCGLANAQLTILLPENAPYRYVNATSATAVSVVPPTWFQNGFDDSSWFLGSGAFGGSFGSNLGNAFGLDTPNAPQYPNGTPWAVQFDPFVRTRFTLTAPTDLTLWLAVDNGVFSVYLNGVQGTGAINAEGAAFRWEHVFDIPASYTVAGENVLALQLEDHGGDTGFALVITSNDPATHPVFSTIPPSIPSFGSAVPCGQTVIAYRGSPFVLSVTASDPSQSDLLTLAASGAPAGSSFSPTLPAIGNPVSTQFEWTPLADADGVDLAFSIADPTGLGAQCTVTVEVRDAPDLIVRSAVAPSSGVSGSTVSVAWETDNIGLGVANAPWIDRIYLSADAVFDGADTFLQLDPCSATLTPQAPALQCSANVPLPNLVGNYYLILVVDADSNVFEVDETQNNNVGCNEIPSALT